MAINMRQTQLMNANMQNFTAYMMKSMGQSYAQYSKYYSLLSQFLHSVGETFDSTGEWAGLANTVYSIFPQFLHSVGATYNSIAEWVDLMNSAYSTIFQNTDQTAPPG